MTRSIYLLFYNSGSFIVLQDVLYLDTHQYLPRWNNHVRRHFSLRGWVYPRGVNHVHVVNSHWTSHGRLDDKDVALVDDRCRNTQLGNLHRFFDTVQGLLRWVGNCEGTTGNCGTIGGSIVAKKMAACTFQHKHLRRVNTLGTGHNVTARGGPKGKMIFPPKFWWPIRILARICNLGVQSVNLA